ncbi:hypothetical protein AALO_G00046380 [Alosa alosa]|uniref:Uncharacterized protein n=1 Tax=Alosa alosa TaxID=278164 RepID=A0AAV6H8T8_9TELE|nr:hypothetical protein AALO_G00046380 [Alosa alosa]
MSAKNRSGQETCAVENWSTHKALVKEVHKCFRMDGKNSDQPPQRAEVAIFWRHPRLVVLLKLVEATMKRQQKEKAGGKGCCY